MHPALSMLRRSFRWLSPAGAKGKLSVLIFHRVPELCDPLFPATGDARSFRERMQWVRELCTVLPLDEAVSALARGSLTERAASITFDDGYADNAEVALPILRELDITATFFVSTGFIDGGRMWNDAVIETVRRAPGPMFDASAAGLGTLPVTDLAARRQTVDALISALKYLPPEERGERVERLAAQAGTALPRDLMMTGAQLRMLAAAGMGIGAHTISHPILASIDAAEARREIAESRETLEGIIGRKVTLFAYPNGKPGRDYGPEHVRIARELGFEAAFTTAPGAGAAGDSFHELPRFTPWDRTPARFALRMMHNLTSTTKLAAA